MKEGETEREKQTETNPEGRGDYYGLEESRKCCEGSSI